MNVYVEVKAGTPCRIWSDYTRNPDFAYPEDDLLKVSFERTNTVSCGYFTFNKSDVRLINP